MRNFPGVLAFASLAAAQVDSWPQFRGPNASGVNPAATKLPVQIGPDRPATWKTPLPPGHSSPVVWGDRIFLTAVEGSARSDAGRDKVVDEGRLVTICLDRGTGKILWTKAAPRPRRERYEPTNSPTSPSPATDGNLVYVFFGDFGLLAYTMDGEERWRIPLGPFNNVNGHGSSPIVTGDLVVLICDQDTDSYLLAVHKATGKIAWKVERPEATRSYSTPAILRPTSGPPELIVPGPYQLTSYDAATGRKLWWVRGLSWQPKSAPVVEGNMVYAHWWEGGGEADTPTETPAFPEALLRYDKNGDKLISIAEYSSDPREQRAHINADLANDGFLDERDWNNYRARRSSRNRLIAVRHGGTGDLTNSNVVWSMQKFLPNSPSPLLYQGVLYLVKDGGILTAADARSGVILKQGRLPNAIDSYYASPVAGAGLVYFASQHGKVSVLRAAAEWEVLATHDFGEDIFATPAIVGNRIYLRTASALYCFGEQSEKQ